MHQQTLPELSLHFKEYGRGKSQEDNRVVDVVLDGIGWVVSTRRYQGQLIIRIQLNVADIKSWIVYEMTSNELETQPKKPMHAKTTTGGRIRSENDILNYLSNVNPIVDYRILLR